MNTLTVNYEEKPCYDIVFSKNFKELDEKLNEFDLKSKRICIVSETNVAPLYMEEVKSVFEKHAKSVYEFVFPAGEASKNVETVYNLYEVLITNKFDRNDMLVALGGGVTGDLTGFAAASYLRGIDFIQVPTTLLAQVDSSIGGKTGVDFKSYKNMVGAFHQPKLVYINVSTLLSLNDRLFLEGMGEIIKHGIIKDYEYYSWLKNNYKPVIERDLDILIKMIKVSCNIKRMVVENDPKEKGERGLLNFGHTIGHAVEKLYDFKYFHGECVAIGMAVAATISCNKGYITKEDREDIINTIKLYNLPVNISNLDPEEIILTTKNDKKMDSGKIKFIIAKHIGEAIISREVTDEDMLLAIKESM